jgi:molybdate transport system permease protein
MTDRAVIRRNASTWPVLLLAAVAAAVLVLPLGGLLVRAPWRSAPQLLGATDAGNALRLSLVTATVSMLVSIALGVPLAWLLARCEFPGRRLLRALVTVPVVLPPVVGGVALLLVFGRRGLLGRYLESWWGVSLPFTTVAVIMAQVFVAMPFLVLSVEGALHAVDARLEGAAASLGSRPIATLRRVTLPLVAPGVLAGAVLCWARALGEFGATITFAGNFPGVTRTVPLATYQALETDPDAAVMLSLTLFGICLAVLVVLRGRWSVTP